MGEVPTTNLVTPALVNLWDFWLTAIQQVAPPLRGKGLHWFADAAQKGYGYCPEYFRYQPVQADGMVGKWLTQIVGGNVSPELGLQQMQAQVNALESVGAQEQKAQASVTALFPTQGPNMAAVAPGL